MKSFKAPMKVNSVGYRFSILTFEHDRLKGYKTKILSITAKFYLNFGNYTLVGANVSNRKSPTYQDGHRYIDYKNLMKYLFNRTKKFLFRWSFL